MNWFIDIFLLLFLLGYLFNGLRRGFARSIAVIVGVLLGGVAAFFLVPLIGAWVPDAAWRTIASVGAAIALILAGHTLGAFVGGIIRRRLADTPLRGIDRVLGGIVNVVVAALVISLLAASVAPLGIPLLSQAIGQSVVISTIDKYTPEPVEAFLARAQSTVVKDALPAIAGVFGGISGTPDVPKVETATDALLVAAASVVRVTGNAPACGQNQSGTGFVIAHDRIVTNAHVVAGVKEPVVETRSGDVLQGRIVYFDPVGDLAVVAVDGMSASVLPLSTVLTKGDKAIYDGYPFGGPFATGPAGVLNVSTEKIADIYNTTTAPREVYTLAANVQQGDSGGPLLTSAGSVAGVVFATSATTSNVGYAMTVTELSPVVSKAPQLTTAVSSSDCISG